MELTSGQKAARTRRLKEAGRKAAVTRGRRAAGKKAAKTRIRRAAARKAAATRKRRAANRAIEPPGAAPKRMLWVTPLARCPEIARGRAGKILIAYSDCA